jgi:hypothetical protein
VKVVAALRRWRVAQVDPAEPYGLIDLPLERAVALSGGIKSPERTGAIYLADVQPTPDLHSYTR